MASVQSDMSRDIALAQQNASSVAVGLDGRTHKGDELAAALRALDPLTPVDGCDKFCRAVDGLAQPNSLTGILEVADLDGNVTRLFLKKVTAAAMAHKGWNDRRRSLLYVRSAVETGRGVAAAATRTFRGGGSRRRGQSVETGRGAAAVATWTFGGSRGRPRRRRECSAGASRGAAAVPRGYSVGTQHPNPPPVYARSEYSGSSNPAGRFCSSVSAFWKCLCGSSSDT